MVWKSHSGMAVYCFAVEFKREEFRYVKMCKGSIYSLSYLVYQRKQVRDCIVKVTVNCVAEF